MHPKTCPKRPTRGRDLTAPAQTCFQQTHETALPYLMSLHPAEHTIDEIIQDFERFRILVIGRSGVGKSSLIDCVFVLKSRLSRIIKREMRTLNGNS
ncbi:hypothetical protein EI94DRAFT_1207695 [Lactarius quietus]|nr:hypothetical protein EI94DRAFT_1207695 [Lactarius quietus]